MNSLLSRAVELQHAAHTLMYLGMDGEPLYSDDFCRQNKDVLLKSDSLFAAKSSDIEEEANLCLALLMGYNATIYNYGDKEQKKQEILVRACDVLERLPDSLLKVRLLTYCYGETYEEALLQSARKIVDGWDRLPLHPNRLRRLKNSVIWKKIPIHGNMSISKKITGDFVWSVCILRIININHPQSFLSPVSIVY